MSPDIGEPEHATRGWNHAMCDVCWQTRRPDREPVRLRATDENGEVLDEGFRSEPCCYCGQPTRGIYVRANPAEVHGAAVGL